MNQGTEVEKLNRWLERDRAIIKALRKENSKLKNEVAHFKSERNKMNSRYDRIMVTLERNAPDILANDSKVD